MSTKPDRLGLKFWLVVDVENKSFFDGLSYVGKDDMQSSDMSLPTDVVMRLMGQIFQLGCNITCGNFFTPLDLVQCLTEKKHNLIRTMPQCRKCQKSRKRKRSCTKQKCFGLIVERQSCLHYTRANQRKTWQFWVASIQMFKFQSMKIRKRNPAQHCNTMTPVGSDVYDQMTRLYSMKAGTRR